MSYSVITHAGKAHIDEILAAAVLAAGLKEFPQEIQRIHPDEAETLVNSGKLPPNTWVLDCGLQFNPDAKLFDHHQSGDLPSTALMLFRHFFPELEETDLGTYFKLVSNVDTQGALSLDDASCISESRDYWGFAHQILVRTFEKEPLTILKLVAAGLEDKIDFESAKKKAAEWAGFPGRIQCEDVAGVNVLYYTEKPPVEIFDGLRGIDRSIIEEYEAAAVYGYDKHDSSIRTLYRTDAGHDVLDFTRCSPWEELFNHKGGFLLRFRPRNPKEWQELIAQSRIEPEE